MSDTPHTPDASPGGAAGPRAGERFVEPFRGKWAVHEWRSAPAPGEPGYLFPVRLAVLDAEADARLLAFGQRAVDALAMIDLDDTETVYVIGTDAADAIRAVLAVVRPAG